MKSNLCFSALSLFFLILTCSESVYATDKPIIHVATVENIIGPVSAEFMIKSLERAEEASANCIIFKLDTPGGLLESTRQITKSFLAAKIPVVIYVAPQGARAASAGVFISYAAHLVAMSPSTNIGAATPVNLGGSSPDSASAMAHKIMNDAVAHVKTMAEKRGRNAEWAEKAVREAVSITEREALELNVINFISPNLDSLLLQINGEEVEVSSGKTTINSKDAEIIDIEMNFRYKILDKISNPNIAYLLMMAGIVGIYFELSNPGAIFPGVIGAISLILAFFALQTLPINYAGLLLILVALVLFILEVKITSFGLLTIGGIIAMTLGSLMLIEQPPDVFSPVLSISLSVIVTTVALTTLFFLFIVSMAVKTIKRQVTTGAEGMLGEIGIAQNKIDHDGTITIHGEIWKAHSSRPVKKGEKVRVLSVTNLVLEVEKV